MAKLNKIQFLLVVSLMVGSSYAEPQLLLANANLTLCHFAKIESSGYFESANFAAQHGTTKVVVYLCSYDACLNIIKPINEKERTKIATELGHKKHELLYLGIPALPAGSKDPRQLIADFVRHTVKFESAIEMLGEDAFLKYGTHPYRLYADGLKVQLRERIHAMSIQK